jgi:hypothetical protein
MTTTFAVSISCRDNETGHEESYSCGATSDEAKLADSLAYMLTKCLGHTFKEHAHRVLERAIVEWRSLEADGLA